MEFVSLRPRRSSWRNVPSGDTFVRNSLVFATIRTLRKKWHAQKVRSEPAVVTAMLEEDNINVFWEEPLYPNGIITKYYVSGNSTCNLGGGS